MHQWGVGGGRCFPLYLYCSLTTLGVFANGGVVCMYLLSQVAIGI